MSSMSRVDKPEVLYCLTDDVEWHIVTAGEKMRGKAEFEQNIGTPPDVDNVRIDIARMTEEDNVVVAEGFVRVSRKEGPATTFQFCDVFEIDKGKIKRLTTFTADVTGSA